MCAMFNAAKHTYFHHMHDVPALTRSPLLTVRAKAAEFIQQGFNVGLNMVRLAWPRDDGHNMAEAAPVQVAEWHVCTPATRGNRKHRHNTYRHSRCQPTML